MFRLDHQRTKSTTRVAQGKASQTWSSLHHSARRPDFLAPRTLLRVGCAVIAACCSLVLVTPAWALTPHPESAPAQAARPAAATTFFTVNSSLDTSDGDLTDNVCSTGRPNANPPVYGVCTLRAAIEQANAISGEAYIYMTEQLTITTSGYTISGSKVTVDGTYLGTYTGSPRVSIVGPGSGTGFDIRTSSFTIRGLQISGFVDAIRVTLEPGRTPSGFIYGNWIGTNTSGTAAAASPNTTGVRVQKGTTGTGRVSGGILIGGTSSGFRNVISGNSGHGVMIGAGIDATQIVGNYIGLNASGTQAVANGLSGILLEANGSDGPNATNIVDNVISGNTAYGVQVDGGATNSIRNNFIGTNAAGTAAVPNGTGVYLGGSSNRVGDIGSSNGRPYWNVISGNTSFGVDVTGTGNSVLISQIGTGLTATIPIANGSAGIRSSGTSASIGSIGTATELPNTIAYNGAEGVLVTGGTGTRITSNQIYSNTGLGIKLGTSGGGPTPNDAGDADTGPNNLQNYPLLSRAETNTVKGVISSTASVSYTLRFFSNSTCDPSGYGEGETYVGSTGVKTDSTGQYTFTATLTATVPEGRFLVATATDTSGNTSEFSPCREVTAAPPTNRTAACSLCPPAVGEPVQTGTGEYFTEPQVDFILGGPLGLTLARYYASRLAGEGYVRSALGKNWMHSFDLRATVENGGRSARIVLGRGNVISFEKSGANWVQQNSEENAEALNYQLKEDTSGDLWMLDPNRNRVMHFRAPGSGGQLLEIVDRNGNSLTLTYSSTGRLATVSDGVGRALAFTYDASGALSQISDGTRTVSYGYAAGFLSVVTDTLGLVTRYAYDPVLVDGAPLLQSIQQPAGNRRYTQAYDSSGRVVRQTNALSSTWTLSYDSPAANSTTISDPNGVTRTHTIANQQILSESRNAVGNRETVQSDDRNRPVSGTDGQGNTTSIGYDADSGHVGGVTSPAGATTSITFTTQTQTFGGLTFSFRDAIGVAFADGTTEQISYDSKGNVSRRVDRTGGVWTYTYDSRGLMLTETNPTGGVVTRTHNADGTLASIQDSDTGPTTFGYDTLRRQTRITYPDGSTYSVVYDLGDRIMTRTDENSAVTTYGYDSNGNITTVTDPAGRSELGTYDALDRGTSTTDRDGGTTSTTYDHEGRVTLQTDPNGVSRQFTYDTLGHPIAVADGGGKTWQFGYDVAGREITRSTPLGSVTRQEYDVLGNRTVVTDALGNASRLEFDSRSFLRSATDPMGRRTEYGADALGRVTGITQTTLGQAKYLRDAGGNITSVVDFGGNTWSRSYTGIGRLAATRDPLGNETRLSYDQRGRLSQVTYPSGETETRTYDGSGAITRIQHSDGTDLRFGHDAVGLPSTANGITLTRNGEGLITSTSNAGVVYDATYDAGQRLQTVTYHGGALTVAYSYNSRNLLTRVTDSVSGATVDMDYDDDGRLTRIARSNGITTTFTWDAGSRLTRIQDGTLADQQMSYDAAGAVTSLTQSMPEDLYASITLSSTTFQYDAAARVASAGYAYDARGRQTASPSQRFTWDAAERLVATSETTLEYDGFSKVIKRTSGGQSTRYYYNHAVDFTPIMAEVDAVSGTPQRYYVWTPTGDLLYAIDGSAGNKPLFYHFDHTGSTLLLTSGSGAVTGAYAYGPYGEVLGRSGATSQPFTYNGRRGVRQEGTGGLYQMGARYYDATAARFLSRDPAGARIGTQDGLNPYSYAAGNPIKYSDPTGNLPFLNKGVTWVVEKYATGELKKKLEKKAAYSLAKRAVKDNVKAAAGVEVDPFQDTYAAAFAKFDDIDAKAWNPGRLLISLVPVGYVLDAADIKDLIAVVQVLNLVTGEGSEAQKQAGLEDLLRQASRAEATYPVALTAVADLMRMQGKTDEEILQFLMCQLGLGNMYFSTMFDEKNTQRLLDRLIPQLPKQFRERLQEQYDKSFQAAHEDFRARLKDAIRRGDRTALGFMGVH